MIMIIWLLCFSTTIYFTESIEIVGRNEWGARSPTKIETIDGKLPFVIIHHSFQPAACYTPNECVAAMKSMQNYHQCTNKWFDIGYSFGVGGDGRIYEGRGFNVIGAHAPGYNDKSIGICLIGDWRNELPSNEMLQATNDLIAYGLSNGHIEMNYTLLGHRQVRLTECPGDALYHEISTWDHFGKSFLNRFATNDQRNKNVTIM